MWVTVQSVPSDWPQTGFRLPPEHLARVDKAARFRGLSRQKFIEAAVMAEVAEVEDYRRTKKRGGSDETSTEAPSIRRGSMPEGLGIAAAMQRRNAVEDQESAQPTQAPVIVNVGTQAASSAVGGGGNVIEHLATYVVSGPAYEEGTRMRTAVGILHASVATTEERRAAAAKLDEAVAAKKNDARTNPRGVRMAFEKIAGLLKGE